MEKLFEEIIECCSYKKVQNLCKKLSKKFSFKSGKDTENLCHLIYWLYILGEIELAKKCIEPTHNVVFDQNYNVWSFIDLIWGLEIRILKADGKNDRANGIIEIMNEHCLTPVKNETQEKAQSRENSRRKNVNMEFVPYKREIDYHLEKGDNKRANDWRFLGVMGMIGYTETGFYPDLNKNKNKLEEMIKNYIEEILK